MLHFEPAIEALVPPDRRGNEYAKSNWLENANFGRKNKSPREAIEMIGRAKNRQEVVLLMTPRDYWYAWNFRAILKFKTIEFRKGGASTSARDALMWAEFAMTFILSAMQTQDPPAYFKTVLPNVEGLKQFLLQEKRESPHMCDPGYLEPLWVGKNGKESIQPIPGPMSLGKRGEGLTKKRQQEMSRYLMLSKIEKTPWMSG